MKKLFFLAMFILLGVVGLNAQQVTMKSQWGGTSDSVTNTGSAYLKAQVSGVGTITVACAITKISGTGAGTAVLQGSLNGTNWQTISLASGLVQAAGSTGVANDTFTLTNVTTQSCSWFLAHNQYSYYRVYIVGSGTELLSLTGILIQRK